MTKEQASKLAKQIADAYGEGMISEKQARRQFEKIVRRYKQNEKWKQTQVNNPAAWLAANSLLSIAPRVKVSRKVSYR